MPSWGQLERQRPGGKANLAGRGIPNDDAHLARLRHHFSRCCTANGSAVSASHTFTVWSWLPETMRLLSGENAASVCPWRVSVSCPVCASHTFTSPGLFSQCSPLPDTIRLPSGENATLRTRLVCPLRVSASCPV